MNDLVIFGPPGAGKGTQGALLADTLGLLRLSTGDVLRDAVKRGTPMGLEAQRYMNAGELVPDEVLIGIVSDYLGNEARDTGVIFDGFPRTIAQAERLDELLATRKRPLRAVLVLEVEDDTLVKRLSGRRSCGVCGALYNVYYEPPRDDNRCDACGSELTTRPDDEPATVKRRLDVYKQQTAPLLDYYEGSMQSVYRINGDRAVTDVQADLLGMLHR